MKHQVVYLRKEDPDITLTTYVVQRNSETKKALRPALLVLPGGGYGFLSEREAEPIALAFVAAGMNAFVLRYSIKEKAQFPRPLVDASLAMQHIRENAQEYNIDPNKVFVVGFSAGGHLAGALGTMWNKDFLQKEIDMPYGINRPTGMILSYPALSMGEFSHPDVLDRLVGNREKTQELLNQLSVEKNVDEDTCPAFIWHTFSDQSVPVENSLIMASVLAQKKVSFEMHIFPDGPHGIALGTKETDVDNGKYLYPNVAVWVSHAVDWMQKL